MNAIQVELAMLEENQRRRTAGENLPAQFRANGPARPRDHHRLPTYAVLQQLLARSHRIAAEQVGNIHFLDIVHPHPAVGQVDEAGNAAHMQRIRFQQTKDFATPGARSRRNCQQDFLRSGFLDHLLDVLGLVGSQPRNNPPGNLVIIVDERHRPHGTPSAQGGN
ncbi:hypothetical protein D9M71_577170 [compost metagenome]